MPMQRRWAVGSRPIRQRFQGSRIHRRRGPNIPDDAIVLSKTRNRRGDQLIGDVFGKGDTDKDGLISIEEFLDVAREIEPEG